MLTRPWDIFFRECIEETLAHSKEVLDIGGGLRIDPTRNNRTETKNAWVARRIQELGVSYQVLDYVDTYHPDIVGDIQNLPLQDNSKDAIVCIAVLEHIENPFKAAHEMYRTLKPGGYCFVYVPFLYYYHAEEGYYGDYWRYTEDSLKLLFKPFSSIVMCKVRGPLETLTRLSPLGRFQFFSDVAFLLDRAFGKLNSKQTSGLYVFLRK